MTLRSDGVPKGVQRLSPKEPKITTVTYLIILGGLELPKLTISLTIAAPIHRLTDCDTHFEGRPCQMRAATHFEASNPKMTTITYSEASNLKT